MGLFLGNYDVFDVIFVSASFFCVKMELESLHNLIMESEPNEPTKLIASYSVRKF